MIIIAIITHMHDAVGKEKEMKGREEGDRIEVRCKNKYFKYSVLHIK